MKRADAFRFIFLTDDHDISYLPTWVKSPKQITDGTWSNWQARTGVRWQRWTKGFRAPILYRQNEVRGKWERVWRLGGSLLKRMCWM